MTSAIPKHKCWSWREALLSGLIKYLQKPGPAVWLASI